MLRWILPVLAIIFALVGMYFNIKTIKMIKNENKSFDDKVKDLSKEEKRNAKKNKVYNEFTDEVVNILFNKKLYPMIKVNDETHYVEVVHQNPGTLDTFTIIDCLEYPAKGKGSVEWKRCVELVNEATDEFIQKHSGDIASGKIIMEEMPKDVIYK